jgi:hypothetical protein
MTTRPRQTVFVRNVEPEPPTATTAQAAGISSSQQLGDLAAGLEPGGEAEAVRLLGARPAMIPLAAFRMRVWAALYPGTRG